MQPDLFDPASFVKTLLPDEEFTSYMQRAEAVLRELIATHHPQTIHPTMLVASVSTTNFEERSLAVVGFEDFDDRMKDQGMRRLGARWETDKLFPLAVFLTSEVWYRMVQTEQYQQEEASGGALRPSEAPDRIEAAMISGMSLDRRAALAGWTMTRDDASAIVGLGEQVLDHPVTLTKPNALMPYILERFFEGYATAFLTARKQKEASHAPKPDA